MRFLSFSFSVLLAISLVSGCQSIPPGASTHASQLRQYHNKTSDATIASLQSSIDTTLFILDRVRMNQDAEWDFAIENYKIGQGDFSNYIEKINKAIEQLDPANDSEAIKSLDLAKNGMTEWVNGFSELETNTKKTKKEDQEAISAFALEYKTQGKDLIDLVTEHTDFTSEQILKYEQLFTAYEMAGKNREAFWGKKLSDAKTDILSRGQQLADHSSKINDAIRQTVQFFGLNID